MTQPNLSSTRRISHDEALDAAKRLIDHYFGNQTDKRVQTRVPVEDTDTDVVLCNYIEQQRAVAPSCEPPRTEQK